jgi:hypothetical protein
MPANDPDVRYCATAIIDLLGFSAHLEAGGNDVRTTIGREAIARLEILEKAIHLMNLERCAVPIAYPKEISYQRINDAIILGMDLPDLVTPSLGETCRHGTSPNDIERHFDLRLYDGEGGAQRFEVDARARLQTDVEDLIKFVGLVARLHGFVNAREHERVFPGAKTICATGFRRRFNRADGREDPLAANFSFANAFVAGRSLRGASFFIDDALARLVSLNAFALNLVRYACFVDHPKKFDPAEEKRDELYLETERVLSNPQTVELFRRAFVFREMDAAFLGYLQVIRPLSEFLTGTKEAATKSWFSSFAASVLGCIRTGPDLATMRAGGAPEPRPRLLLNDISCDIRVLLELIESGSSPTADAKDREELLRGSLLVSAPPWPGSGTL